MTSMHLVYSYPYIVCLRNFEMEKNSLNYLEWLNCKKQRYSSKAVLPWKGRSRPLGCDVISRNHWLRVVRGAYMGDSSSSVLQTLSVHSSVLCT